MTTQLHVVLALEACMLFLFLASLSLSRRRPMNSLLG